MGFGRHVHGEIVSRVGVTAAVLFRGGNHPVGGESTRCEEVGVDPSVWVLRGWIHLGESTGLGDDGAEDMAFGGVFVKGGTAFTGWGDIVAISRDIAENVDLCEIIVSTIQLMYALRIISYQFRPDMLET